MIVTKFGQNTIQSFWVETFLKSVARRRKKKKETRQIQYLAKVIGKVKKEERLDIDCVINMTRTLPIALYGHMLIWPFFNLWPLKERSDEEVTMDTWLLVQDKQFDILTFEIG